MKIKTCLKKMGSLAVSLAATVFLTANVSASDPVGIYAIVDKVVFEPSEAAPERIQIWGAFSLAEGRGQAYANPAGGYLYYKLGKEKQEVARKEWNDLRAIAGKEEVVGFGVRWEEKGKVRKPDSTPSEPDGYPLGIGLQKMRRPDYEPVKKLIAYHKELQAPTKKVSQGERDATTEIVEQNGTTLKGTDRTELTSVAQLPNSLFSCALGPTKLTPAR